MLAAARQVFALLEAEYSAEEMAGFAFISADALHALFDADGDQQAPRGGAGAQAEG